MTTAETWGLIIQALVAVGTIGAVVVAIRLANTNSKPKIHMLIEENNKIQGTYKISATNVGLLPVHLLNFSVLVRGKYYNLEVGINFATPNDSNKLEAGDSAYISFYKDRIAGVMPNEVKSYCIGEVYICTFFSGFNKDQVKISITDEMRMEIKSRLEQREKLAKFQAASR